MQRYSMMMIAALGLALGLGLAACGKPGDGTGQSAAPAAQPGTPGTPGTPNGGTPSQPASVDGQPAGNPAPAGNVTKITFNVKGMDCAGCAKTVTRAAESAGAKVLLCDHKAGLLVVECAPESREKIVAAVQAKKYQVVP